jgi:hypothetical protein
MKFINSALFHIKMENMFFILSLIQAFNGTRMPQCTSLIAFVDGVAVSSRNSLQIVESRTILPSEGLRFMKFRNF